MNVSGARTSTLVVTIAAVAVAATAVLAGCSSSAAPAQSPSASAGTPGAIVTSLPPTWPAEIPAPAGFELIEVTSTAAGNGSTAVYRGTGDVAGVDAALAESIGSAGYAEAKRTNRADTHNSTWTKDSSRLSVRVTSAGATTTVSITSY